MFDWHRNTHFRISDSGKNGIYVGPSIFSEPHETFLSRRVVRLIIALIFFSIPGIVFFAQYQSQTGQSSQLEAQLNNPIEVQVPTSLAILK